MLHRAAAAAAARAATAHAAAAAAAARRTSAATRGPCASHRAQRRLTAARRLAARIAAAAPLAGVRYPASAAIRPPPPRSPPLAALVRLSSSFFRASQLHAVGVLTVIVGLRMNGDSSRHSPKWSRTAHAARWSGSDAHAPERARAGEPAPLIGAEEVGGVGIERRAAVLVQRVVKLYKHHEDRHRRRQRGATRGWLRRAGSEPGRGRRGRPTTWG